MKEHNLTLPLSESKKQSEIPIELPTIPGMTPKEFVNYKQMTLDVSGIWLVSRLNIEAQNQYLWLEWLCTLAGMAGALASPSWIGKAVSLGVGLGCAVATGFGHKKMAEHQRSEEEANRLLRQLRYGNNLPHLYTNIFKLDWAKTQVRTPYYKSFSKAWDHYTRAGYRLWRQRERILNRQRAI